MVEEEERMCCWLIESYILCRRIIYLCRLWFDMDTLE